MEADRGFTQAERELTQILVTELLAHQFCSPVQWINTQDAILRDFETERLIEIGPAETLVNMAKKTIKAGYETSDIALGFERELLSYKKNVDAIYYKMHDAPAPTPATPAATSTAPAQPAPIAAPVDPVPAWAASVPDKAPAPVDVITVLVALALKKSAADVPTDKTIKALCGGRSTVQNEIVGDLTKEFGSLPDQPEDISLADLSNTLADSGLGSQLGPCTNALLGKVTSAKMALGSNIAAIRQYLDSRWGFKHGLQDRALLSSISRQPSSRLPSEKEVHSFFDDIAHDVLRSIGVDPTSLSSGGSQAPSTGAVTISSEALDALQSQQRNQDRTLLDLYAKRVGHDINGAHSEALRSKATIEELQGRIDTWEAEHGEAYERGIASQFDTKKVRKYDSYWNWVIQDILAMFSQALSGPEQELDSQLRERLARFPIRVTPQLLDVVAYLLQTVEGLPDTPRKDITREWLQDLQSACRLATAMDGVFFKNSVTSTVPVLQIDEKGEISVQEVPRLPESLGSVSALTLDDIDDNIRDDISESVYDRSSRSAISSPAMSEAMFSEPPRRASSDPSPFSSPYSQPVSIDERAGNAYHGSGNLSWTPELLTKGPAGWRRNDDITNSYLDWFQRATTDGVSFTDKAIMVTGAGRNSIGSEIASIALAAGAKVLVTTSSYSKDTVDYYQDLYRQNGASKSQLVVVPFNGGSSQDTQNLVKYIYDDVASGGLGWDLDHVIPFAAIGEAGRSLDSIDDKSELAHRVMLTNLLRLLGAIKTQKAQRRIETHPTHVLLPLSPNHGIFGQDGLYAESKIGLEALLNKWWSEDWNDYLTLCGTTIGWTRGTGLMSNNDVLATGIEEDLAIRTFSAFEMAWHIVGLMDESVASFCDVEPLMADLAGGLSASMKLKPVLQQIQERINAKSEVKKAIYKEELLEDGGREAARTPARRKLVKKAKIEVEAPDLPDFDELRPLAAQLQGMVDLERVVVVAGFGEAGPCGSARTRWQAECSGTFTVDGCLELAWIMGLIKYHNGPLQGKDYCGWLDVATKAPIADAEVKTKYEQYIIQHTGIRIIEQREHDITSPDKEPVLHEVVITEDLEPFEVSLETAESFKREHGDKVVIRETASGQYSVVLKGGITLMVPKSVPFKNGVGAQMPTGWDPKVYGISDDIIAQVDPITLYALVSTVEAFLSAGITDPFELYQHIHVSEFGNAVGSSFGGVKSLHEMFKQRFLDRQIQKDILAETFVNTAAAWINMLLVGSSGPIRTPVGACATSLESVDTGYDLIASGKAKAVLVGGTDALERDTAFEFANMQATIDADKDAAAGRTPKESSRPTTTTRAGFVEAEGCGVQLLTTARLALDMGLPIRAVIALSHTASDKIGRSLPAPGKGVLSIATEKRSKFPSPLLDMGYRRRQLSYRLRQIEDKRDMELAWLNEQLRLRSAGCDDFNHNNNPTEYAEHCRQKIEADAQRAFREAQRTYGNDFWKDDDSISALRGSLAVWGLTVDDLSVASLHGTSTRQNDANETAVLQRQLEHLGRARGNVLPCVAQKSLLGHGKGAAGAFALNGCLQTLATGIVPGNRNADNVDAELRSRDLLFYPSQTYRLPSSCSSSSSSSSSSATGHGPARAFSVTSFGFGQKGAQVIGVHARYLFASISEQEYDGYRRRVATRQAAATARLQEGIYAGKLVQLKEKSVYEDADVEAALLHRA
ncbi:fatty acid synthase subunit alpha [Xylariales sp. PMI_506]|nr:fatty acid synthase subunit alpha [Xylariales sp. PMI_506]